MSNSMLLIPPKLKVGFQERGDTYTGRLGYVIYYDSSGKLCKEKSWQGWRDKKIEPVEYENVPTEGFVINKNGGGRGGHSWNDRQAFVRMYDPRNFEFEIAVDNLVFILCQGGCQPGKGLEGKFVYAWRGGRLVLMPCHSQEYLDSTEFTRLKDRNLTLKELVPGGTYLTKTLEKRIYLGRFSPVIKLEPGYRTGAAWTKLKGAPHLFYDPSSSATEQLGYTKFNYRGPYIYEADLRDYAEPVSLDPVPNLGDLIEAWSRSEEGSPIERLELVDTGLPIQRQLPYNGDVWPVHDTAFWVKSANGCTSYTYERGVRDSLTYPESEYPHLKGSDLWLSRGPVVGFSGSQIMVEPGTYRDREFRDLARAQKLLAEHGTKRLRAVLKSGEVRWFWYTQNYRAIHLRPEPPPRLEAQHGTQESED